MKLIVIVVGFLFILGTRGEQNEQKQTKNQQVEEKGQTGQENQSITLYNSDTNNLQNDTNIVTTFDSVDWRNQGIISPVKDQGTCFAQSAFSTAAQIQTVFHSYKSQVVDISQQYLLSCGTNKTLCTGIGYYALNNLIDIELTKKIVYQSDLPYKSSQTVSTFVPIECDEISKTDVSRIKYSSFVHFNLSESNFILLISNYPVLSEIKASQQFYNYKEGIFSCVDDENVTYENNYYGVQVIGYNKNERYYIVKNSMGSSWGQQGFGRISMDHDCGLKRQVIELTYVFSKSMMVSWILLFLLMIISY